MVPTETRILHDHDEIVKEIRRLNNTASSIRASRPKPKEAYYNSSNFILILTSIPERVYLAQISLAGYCLFFLDDLEKETIKLTNRNYLKKYIEMVWCAQGFVSRRICHTPNTISVYLLTRSHIGSSGHFSTGHNFVDTYDYRTSRWKCYCCTCWVLDCYISYYTSLSTRL